MTAAFLRIRMGKHRGSHNPCPYLVTSSVHVQAIADEEVSWFAGLIEHRRDYVNVVQIGALRGPVANGIIDERLQGKLRKAQLRRLDRDEIDGRVAQYLGLAIHEFIKIRHHPRCRLAGIKIILARVEDDEPRFMWENETLGEFGAVITFAANVPGETRTLPLAIYSALQTPGGEHAALKLACLSLVIAIGALWLSEALGRRARRWAA